MSKYELPYFEEIELTDANDYYEINIEFEGKPLQLDINNESDSIDEDTMDGVKMFLENLSEYKIKAKNAIIDDFKNDETVKDYIEHHIDELDDDELASVLKDQDKKLSMQEQILNALHLERVGFYVDDEDEFAIFDFTIGSDITDYLIVVKFDIDGDVQYLDMES